MWSPDWSPTHLPPVCHKKWHCHCFGSSRVSAVHTGSSHTRRVSSSKCPRCVAGFDDWGFPVKATWPIWPDSSSLSGENLPLSTEVPQVMPKQLSLDCCLGSHEGTVSMWPIKGPPPGNQGWGQVGKIFRGGPSLTCRCSMSWNLCTLNEPSLRLQEHPLGDLVSSPSHGTSLRW